jgi:hypothetical protein
MKYVLTYSEDCTSIFIAVVNCTATFFDISVQV